MPSELLRHRAFRRLWCGDVVSMFGDWFTYVAVGVLALEADSGLWAVAFVLLAHTLPRAALAPLGGRLADRHDRRALMVVGSLLRALAVAAMIAAAAASSTTWLAALLCLRMGLSAVVEPAASAALPQLVPLPLVGPANAWIGATWSVVFGLGVVVGGAVTAWVGPIAAMAIDAGTFVIAAAIFATLPALAPGPEARSRAPLGEAWAHLRRDRQAMRGALAKTPVALANGGAWVLMHALAGRPEVGGAALALGALHGARAAGTGIGPLLWGRSRRLRGTSLGLDTATWVCLGGVAGFALAGPSWGAALGAGVWGLGLGACWVAATTRVQVSTPSEVLGRVAAIDLLGHTLGGCVGGVVGAWAASASGVDAAAGWAGLSLGALAWVALVWATRARRVA